MQTAKQYVPRVAVRIERTRDRMPASSAKPAAYVRQEPSAMSKRCLTIEEQRICDMATD